MNETFKINVYFDEKGEEIENIISHFLIDMLEKKVNKFLLSQYLDF